MPNVFPYSNYLDILVSAVYKKNGDILFKFSFVALSVKSTLACSSKMLISNLNAFIGSSSISQSVPSIVSLLCGSGKAWG